MTDLDKAREWAERMGKIEGLMPGHRAAAEVIQALPDLWVDAEKLKVIIADMCDSLEVEATTDFSKGFDNSTMTWLNPLKDLLSPKLPTLADMTEEEQAECQWMQCRANGFSEDTRLVIAYVADHWITLWREDGNSIRTNPGAVTPLPDLPKLQWPGGVVDCEIVEEPETADSSSIHTPMQPSEVPPNEPWLIEANGEKAIGTRYKGDAHAPWSVAALDGSFAGDYNDREITLIHKLVPETHALPEGMRLADHEEYGRVVTSPWGDGDDDYKIFFLNEDARGGADYEYAHESTLTFLDGEPNA